MRKPEEEYVQGDKSVLKNWLLVFFVYLLVLLWLEPLIDLLLLLAPPEPDMAAIQAFNERKEYIAQVTFTIARSLPVMLFMWIGYQCTLQARIPPRGVRMPITIKVIKGQQARMGGLFVVAVSMILLLRELNGLLNI